MDTTTPTPEPNTFGASPSDFIELVLPSLSRQEVRQIREAILAEPHSQVMLRFAMSDDRTRWVFAYTGSLPLSLYEALRRHERVSPHYYDRTEWVAALKGQKAKPKAKPRPVDDADSGRRVVPFCCPIPHAIKGGFVV